MPDGFTANDEKQLTSHGISLDEAKRQLEILRTQPTLVELDRPCTIGDGIVQIQPSDWPGLKELHNEAARESRWTKFTPASGAASRMFTLDEKQQQQFCKEIDRFAFAPELFKVGDGHGVNVREAADRGDYETIQRLMLSPDGLNFDKIAKGLLPFHRHGDMVRTAFDEHSDEAAACFRNLGDVCRAHFTVGSQHVDAFEFRHELASLENPDVIREVSFSIQEPSTDTIGLETTNDDSQNNQPLRDSSGSLVLRPGGHGALIENLNRMQADLVFVKNIDNVQHWQIAAPAREQITILCGYLVRVQTAIHEAMRLLDSNPTDEAAAQLEAIARSHFPHAFGAAHTDGDKKIAALREFFHRPLRVCGMVVNQGEPGGGPFWVRHDGGGKTVQIVESVEIADDQKNIVSRATHFNPVLMALGLRDHRGDAFNLHDFVEPSRAIITQKSVDGKMARVIERPGLWNGAMARWNTIFVEVDIATFSPAKRVVDLLNPAHQPVEG